MAIHIGLGANLRHPRFGDPVRTLGAALRRLAHLGVRTRRRSSWYRSAPVPASDQPWYVNAVAEVSTGLGPEATLAALHRVEAEFGRVREARNAARWIDIDLIDYDNILINNENISIPHPRSHLRAFVLLPLAELVPAWRHPRTGDAIVDLIAALPPDQRIERLAR